MTQENTRTVWKERHDAWYGRALGVVQADKTYRSWWAVGGPSFWTDYLLFLEYNYSNVTTRRAVPTTTQSHLRVVAGVSSSNWIPRLAFRVLAVFGSHKCGHLQAFLSVVGLTATVICIVWVNEPTPHFPIITPLLSSITCYLWMTNENWSWMQ